MIAENIEKSLSYLSLITNLSLSTVKIYKKVIKKAKKKLLSRIKINIIKEITK
ncbi:hypothetical protein ONA23_05005 [Mycoplasmopsis cynos]|uniref:hypothetical protein n=1 Tax=Mycoplasmopsis cynos TaxID=171284 RepID=UPI0024CA95A2|nr:hypothetical protein [Mycoplasmopsis cynos]WAM06327.1 hypothetical protein ONA23_05005 [Mycoplasmopsis cynos]